MSILSDNQLYDYCIEVAKCPALLEELNPYAKQALKHYAMEQQTRKFFSDGERDYYRAMMPVYAAADVVLALLDAPTLAPSEGQETAVSIAAPQSAKPLRSCAKKTCLNAAKGLNAQDAKDIFEGLRELSSGEKERAAALTALMVNGYLTGGCANVIEWFKAEIGGKVSTRTLSNSRREYRDEGQLLSRDEQRIFDTVEKLAKKVAAKR